MIDEEIRAALAPIVTDEEVHPLRRRQQVAQPIPLVPCVVYTIIDDSFADYRTLCGISDLHMVRVQLDCYASRYLQARGLAIQVAEAMDALGDRLTMTPFPDDTEGVFRWLLEYSMFRNGYE